MNQLIPGIEFDFGGGRRYLVPPLSLGTLERLQDRLTALSTLGAIEPESVRTIVDATHAALQRNYPDITRDQVADLVDVGNMGEVYECVMDVAGVRRRALAEAAAGNPSAPAAASTAGAASTPA